MSEQIQGRRTTFIMMTNFNKTQTSLIRLPFKKFDTLATRQVFGRCLHDYPGDVYDSKFRSDMYKTEVAAITKKLDNEKLTPALRENCPTTEPIVRAMLKTIFTEQDNVLWVVKETQLTYEYASILYNELYDDVEDRKCKQFLPYMNKKQQRSAKYHQGQLPWQIKEAQQAQATARIDPVPEIANETDFPTLGQKRPIQTIPTPEEVCTDMGLIPDYTLIDFISEIKPEFDFLQDELEPITVEKPTYAESTSSLTFMEEEITVTPEQSRPQILVKPISKSARRRQRKRVSHARFWQEICGAPREIYSPVKFNFSCNQHIARDEHYHQCPYCHMSYVCACTTIELTRTCPNKKCKNFKHYQHSRLLNYHISLRTEIENSQEKPKIVIERLLNESLNNYCDCVYRQIPSIYRYQFKDILYASDAPQIGGKIACKIVEEPDEDKLNQQETLAVKSAQRSHITHKHLVQRALNQIADISWVKQIGHKQHQLRPTVWNGYDKAILMQATNMYRNQEIAEEMTITIVKKKSTKQKIHDRLIFVNSLKVQRDRIEKEFLEKELKRVEKEKLEHFSLDKEERKEEELLEKTAPRFKRLQQKIKEDTSDISNTVFDLFKQYLSNVATPTKPSNQREDPYRVIDGKVYYLNQEMGDIQDRDIISKLFSHLYKYKLEDFEKCKNEYQADIFGPLKSLVTTTVTNCLKADTMTQAAIASRLCTFILNIGSSATALIDSIRGERSFIKCALHVLSLCATVTDMILSIMVVVKLYKKSTDLTLVAPDMIKSYAASIIHMLSDQGFVSSTHIPEILKAAQIEDFIMSPPREIIERLEKGEMQPEHLVCNTILDRWKCTADKDLMALMEELSKLAIVPHGQVGEAQYTFYCWADIVPLLEEHPSERALLEENYFKMNTLAIKYLVANNKPLQELSKDFRYVWLIKELIYRSEAVRLYEDQTPDLKYHLNATSLLLTYLRKSTAICSELDLPHKANFDILKSKVSFATPLIITEMDLYNLGIVLQPQAFSFEFLMSFCCLLSSVGISIYDYCTSTKKESMSKTIVMGSNLMRSLNTSVKDSKAYIEDCAYEFFGWKIGQKYADRENLRALMEALLNFKERPDPDYCQNPELYYDAKMKIKEARDYVTTIGRDTKSLSTGESQSIQSINSLIAQCEQKILGIEAIFSTLGTKPSTEMVIIWGEKGSGKTTFISRWLCPKICERKGWKNGTYDLAFNNDGNSYFKEYAFQKLAKLDDFLKNGIEDKFFAKAQEMLGTNTYNLEGAFKKNQPNGIVLVAGSSNYAHLEVPRNNAKGYTATTVASVLGRATWFHCFNNAQWDFTSSTHITKRNLDRHDVIHKEDYSDLRFFEYKMPGVEEYEKHRIMEETKNLFPVLKPENCVTLNRNEFNMAIFESNPISEYKLGEWYKVDTPKGTVYVKEHQKEGVLEECLKIINDSEISYDKFLKETATNYISKITSGSQLKDIYVELGLKGIGKELIDSVIETKFPSKFQSGRTSSTNHLVVSVFGPSGSGKTHFISKIVAPKLNQGMQNMDIVEITTPQEAKSLVKPSIVLLNDLITKQNGELYMDILANLPSPCIILIGENLYTHSQKVSRIFQRSSHICINDAPWYTRPIVLSTYYVAGYIPINYLNVKNGIFSTPMNGMHEGWYRRLGIEGYTTSEMSVKEIQRQITSNGRKLAITWLFGLISSILAGYISLPLSLIPILLTYWYLSTNYQDYMPEPCEIPFVSADMGITGEMIQKGQYYSNGKIYLDNEIVPQIFEKYKATTLLASNFVIERVSESVATRNADVVVCAPTMRDLPSFINDKSKVMRSLRLGANPSVSDYMVQISDRVQRSSFSTCIDDFRLQDNCTQEQVVEMARRTYGVLANACADFSVSVICDDFEVFAQFGKIKYFMATEQQVVNWTIDEVNVNGVPMLHVSKYQDLTIIKTYELPFSSLVSLYTGQYVEHPNVDYELMRQLWQNKGKIERMAPYANRAAIQNVNILSSSEMMKSLLEVRDMKIKQASSISGMVISAIVGLVSLFSFGVLCYSTFAPKQEVKSEKQVAQLISSSKDICLSVFMNGEIHKIETCIEVTNVYTVTIRLRNPIDVYIDSYIFKNLVKSAYFSYLAAAYSIVDFSKYTVNVQGEIREHVNIQQAQPKKNLYKITFKNFNLNKRNMTIGIAECEGDETECIEASLIYDASGKNRVEINAFNQALMNRLKEIEEALFEEEDEFQSSDKKKMGKDKRRMVRGQRINIAHSTHDCIVDISKPNLEFKLVERIDNVFESVSRIPPLNPQPIAFEEIKRLVNRNTVHLTNMNDCENLYGIGFFDKYIITNAHAFPKYDMPDNIHVRFDDPKGDGVVVEHAKVVCRDTQNDLAVLELTTGNFRFKKITNHFISESDTKKVSTSYFIRPQGNDNLIVQAVANIPEQNITIAVKNLRTGKVDDVTTRIITNKFLDSNFETLPGDCGCPLLVNVTPRAELSVGSFKVGGIHGWGNPHTRTSTGPVVTREMLTSYINFLSSTKEDEEPEIFEEQSRKNIQDLDLIQLQDMEIDDTVKDIAPVAFTDSEIVDILHHSQQKKAVPKEQWPLFMPNPQNYGVSPSASNLSYVGFIPTGRTSTHNSSAHRLSPWAPLAESMGFKNPVMNTIFDPKAVEDKSMLITSDKGNPSIIYTQISYYNDPSHESPMFADIVRDVTEEMKSHYVEWFGGSFHRILNDVECMNGLICRFDKIYGALEGMDLDSSPGFFSSSILKCSKRKQLVELDHEAMEEFKETSNGRLLYKYASTPEGQRMKRRLDQKYENAKRGVWTAYVAKDSLKDELVAVKKVKIGKTRVFVACDDADNMFARKVLGTFCAIQKIAHMSRHCQVGVNPRKEFHFLHRRLQQISMVGESGDFKHWDKNLNRRVLQGVLECVKAAIIDKMCQSNKLKYENFFKIIYLDMTHGFSYADGILYQRHRGMPSGHLTTAPINSEVNFFYHLINCKINLILANQQPKRSLKYRTDCEFIMKITDMLAYGDDKKTSIQYEYTDVINFSNMKKVFSEYFGLQYTDPQKNEAAYNVMDLEKLDFLSRSFFVSEKGVVFPTLKEESILGMIFWCTSNTKEVLKNTLENLKLELQLLSRERYNVYRPLFHAILDEYKARFHDRSIGYLPEYEYNLTLVTRDILNH